MSTADELKNKGNAAFQAGNHAEAIEWFSKAIEMDPSKHTYYSNRSAAYLSMSDGQKALDDALQCITIKPDWAKGYGRKGSALHALNKFEESVAAFEEGLKIDPNNNFLNNGLAEVKAAQGEAANAGPGGLPNVFGQDMWVKIGMHPKLKGYLSDPAYVRTLQALQANPNSMQSSMGDPRVLETFMFLMGMDVNAMNVPGADGAAGAPGASAATGTPEGGEDAFTDIPMTPADIPAPAAAAAPAPAAAAPAEPAVSEEKSAGDSLKQEGNAAYKARDFPLALSKYTEAIAANGSDMSYYTNRAAVQFEQKDYDACIADCKAGIDVGRDNRAKYEMIAKAYARIGNALMKKADFTGAIENYQNALLEHRTQDVERRLKRAKLKEKEAAAKAYLNPEEALAAKNRGNDFFRAGDFPSAVREYTDAIARDPTTAAFYCNRGAAYTKLTEFARARDDCEKALKMDPNYVKAYTRLGAIQFFMKEYHKALDTYKAGLAVDPNSAECAAGVQQVMGAIQAAASSGEVDQERAKHGMADPEIQAILQDPMVQNVLRDFQSDPRAAQRHLQDPGMAAKLEKLIAAGVLQMG